MWTLKGLGKSFQIGYCVVVAGKGNCVLCEELLDDLQCLFQTTNAHSSVFKEETYLFIFGAVPSCPNAEFEAPAGEKIERCDLLGEQCRVTKVVVEYNTADA